MATEYRPTVIGDLPDTRNVSPQKAIALLEDDLMNDARALRKIRADFVNGKMSEEQFDAIENRFSKKLADQRKVLQLLRSAAGR